MARIVPLFILLDEASIYALLDLAIDLVKFGLLGRGTDAVSPQTFQTVV